MNSQLAVARQSSLDGAPASAVPGTKSLGAWTVIIAIVVAQFVEIALGEFGGFVLSIQKIVVALALPVGLLLLGRFWVPGALAALGGLYGACLAGASLFGVATVPDLTAQLSTVFLNLFAAASLVVALRAIPDGIVRFAKAWTLMAAVSAVVTIGQFMELVPLLAVPDEQQYHRAAVDGFVRATGFRFDPNFQAVVLVLGIALVPLAWRGRWRVATTAIILLGTVSTLSRMGTLAAIVLIVLTSNLVMLRGADVVTRIARIAITCVAAAAAAVVAYLAAPEGLRRYIEERLEDIWVFVDLLMGRQVSATSSGAERADQNLGAIGIIADSFPFGVGAGQVEWRLAEAGFANKAAHNTYLETVCIGGLFGLMFLAGYLWVLLRGVLRKPNLLDADAAVARSCCRWFVLVFLGFALFITFNYNSILWVPVALSLHLSWMQRSAPRAGQMQRE